MKKQTKTLYIRILGNIEEPSMQMSLDDLEEQSIKNMSTERSFGILISDAYSIGSDYLYKEEKETLRFIMRYRKDEPNN